MMRYRNILVELKVGKLVKSGSQEVRQPLPSSPSPRKRIATIVISCRRCRARRDVCRRLLSWGPNLQWKQILSAKGPKQGNRQGVLGSMMFDWWPSLC